MSRIAFRLVSRTRLSSSPTTNIASFVTKLSILCLAVFMHPTLLSQAQEPSPKSPREKAPNMTPSAESIQERIRAIREETGAPAMWASVYRSENHRPVIELDQIQYAGQRKHDAEIVVTGDDLVHLGSCTKAMTATMIAQAISAGKLKFTTTIGEVFSEEKAATAPESQDEIDLGSWSTVTIAELLTHRSGAPANGPWDEIHQEHAKDIVSSRHALLSWLCEQRRPRKPRFVYSNVGYALLGHILEHIENQSWETLIHRDLFQPLGITSAGFGPVTSEKEQQASWGHYVEVTAAGVLGEGLGALLGRKAKPKWKAVQIDNPPPLGPAGRCHMQIADWAKFVSVYADLKPDPRLKINESVWNELTDTSEQADGQPYAGGWVPFGTRDEKGFTLYHNGSNTTWYCVAMTRPHDRRFALVVSNCFSQQVITSCDEFAEDLVKQKP